MREGRGVFDPVPVVTNFGGSEPKVGNTLTVLKGGRDSLPERDTVGVR